VVKGEKVQRELSIQLKCAGRSYAQILDANRELAEEMHIEIDKREDKIEDLEKIIRQRDQVIREADKPWKEEVAKRELKLLKLKEKNEDLIKKVAEEAAKVPPIHVHYKKQVEEKENAMESVLRECAGLREEIAVNKEAYEIELQAVKAPFAKQILELQKEKRELSEAAEDKESQLKREIKSLQNKQVGLQKELDKVDHTPYERKIDVLQDGFQRLVKDFEIKTQLNSENVAKMREGFENVIEGLDKQVQAHEMEARRRIKPFQEEIERLKDVLKKKELRLEEMKEGEADLRAKEAAVQKDLREELAVAKEAVDLYLKEMTKSKMALEKARAEMEGDNGPWKAMKKLERRLDEVTQECAQMMKHKDLELIEKNNIVRLHAPEELGSS
jgi:chromosome segregation ATPase